jgi:hypothetical protein
MKKIFIAGMTIALLVWHPGKILAQSQMDAGGITGLGDRWGHLEEMGEHLLEELEGLNEYTQTAASAWDLYNATLAMDNSECVPDLSVDASHMMPTACRGNGECQSCYTGAYRELAFIRRQLARLSCIYNNTKTFNEAAIAFGDNTSGIHAVTGLSWQNARAEILHAYNSFKQTYDNKYTGMINGLQQALMSISRCEGQYGTPDWYQRFVFIYFEMMKEKYKRTD